MKKLFFLLAALWMAAAGTGQNVTAGSSKLLRNGRLYILVGDRLYDATGRTLR